MTKIDDGGQAFPSAIRNWNDSVSAKDSGLSIRDWFAGQAPEPPSTWWGGNVPDCAGRAMWNYQYADAMVAEKAKRGATHG